MLEANILSAISNAKFSLENNKITGQRLIKTEDDSYLTPDVTAPDLWPRFLEIGTYLAIFSDDTGIVKYNLSDIDVDLRISYSWYGTWR